MSLPRVSVHNPIAVNLLMFLLLGVGGYYALTLTRDLFPPLDPEQIVIAVEYPGATPEEIEKTVTRQIEREIEGLDDIDEVQSSVSEGLSVTTITLEEGVDKDRLLSDVQNEVAQVEGRLPLETEEPREQLVRPFFPVIAVVLHGDVSQEALHRVALEVEDDLRKLPGIAQVVVSGVLDRELVAEIPPERLEEHGLTFEQVGSAVAAANLDLPGGQLKTGRGNVPVRTVGENERALAVEDIIVAPSKSGAALRLRDIARVFDGFEDKVERGRFAKEDAVQFIVFKTPEQDALKIADQVRAYVDRKSAELDGMRLSTTTDLSRFIMQRLELMVRNAKWGLLFVALALALFLDLRVAFWVAVGLPISFLGSFIVMKYMGGTINLISLFGMIVVLGLIVDDAIVIGENVFTKMRQGMKPLDAAIQGTNEVAIPVLCAVLTTIAAFLPMAFIAGVMGAFLKALPIVVIAALSVSLIEAFIILPAHLAHHTGDGSGRTRFGRLAAVGRVMREARHGLFERFLPRHYERMIRFLLRWRYPALAGALALLMLASGLIAGGIVPFVLLQDDDAETVTVDLEMAAGTPEERTIEVMKEVEGHAETFDEVANIFGVVGTSFSDRGRETAADPATVAQLTMELVPAEERESRGLSTSEELLNELRQRTGTIPGVKRLTFASRGGGPQGADIDVRVMADDEDRLREAVEWVEGVMREYAGVNQVENDYQYGKTELKFELLESARALGLTTRDLASQLRHALFGFEAQRLQSEKEEIRVRVRLPESARDEVADLERFRVQTATGARVPLEEIASVRTGRGFGSITRYNGQRAVSIKAAVDESVGNVAEITSSLEERFAGIGDRFAGVGVRFEGRRKESTESLGSLKIGFPLALFVIYAIIAILFRSYLQPLIVMVTIPFAFGGAVVGHLIAGYPFTLLSMIGGLALAGIVVNDGLILVDFINRRRREGLSVLEAAIRGGRERLRPILLTSITTICGLAPLMLERSFQAQFLIPMAVSIVYGLAFATFLILVLVPILYLLVDDLRRLWGWMFGLPWQAAED